MELYNHKQKQFSWKGLIFFMVASMTLTAGFFVFGHYYQSTIKIEVPVENPGQKVVIQLSNGLKVYTYENFVFKKDGKIYYQGERNIIDLTGGTVTYENWQ